MKDFKHLHEVYKSLLKDIDLRSVGHDAKIAFQAYWETVNNFAGPYVQDGFLEKERAQARFLSETAVLHLLLSLVSSWCNTQTDFFKEKFFQNNPEAYHYFWYSPPERYTNEVGEWGKIHNQCDPHVVALTADNSLAGVRHRVLGEFFTPIDISNHLLSLSAFDPTLITKKKVCDPACGSGNLLSTVVIQVTEAVRSGRINPHTALECIDKNIIGFDIQPIAILLTRLQLLLASMPNLQKVGEKNEDILDKLRLSNIKLYDPLRMPEKQAEIIANFDLVLGNPPFLKVVKNKLTFISQYEEVLNGQPNLYQLFLWWAIKATKPGGSISFLLPQSIRSGQYFHKLRRKISELCDITAVTCLVDRTGVFDTVNQQIMAINLRKVGLRRKNTQVIVRVNPNGHTLNQVNGIYLKQAQVVRTQREIPIWCISDYLIDYKIMERVCRSLPTLKDTGYYTVVNGGFVWNQHKDKLLTEENNNSSPLVSSCSIGIHDFIFPPFTKKVSQRLFVDRTQPIAEPIYTQVAILLKRTTPKKFKGRRIIATLLPRYFLDRHPKYFAENHVNLILSLEQDEELLLGLVAWLDSRLANFIFGMINGSSHLSKFELEILPLPVSLLAELNKLVAPLYQGNQVPLCRTTVMNTIDEYIFNAFALSKVERHRLRASVPDI
jgi:adenine-specific DNA-methyltransferase